MPNNPFLDAMFNNPAFSGTLPTLNPAAIRQLEGELGKIISDSLGEILTGAKADIEIFGIEIAKDVAKAILVPNPEIRRQLMEELYGQVKLTAEINRVRAVNISWEATSKIITAIAGAALSALTKVVI